MKRHVPRRAGWPAIAMPTFAGLCVGIIGLSLQGASAWAANLLTNGSFDGGTYSFGGDGAQDLAPGSTTITGWTVITNDVAPIAASNIYSIIPEDGNVSLDLQGYTDGSPYGGVQQSITTQVGAQYQMKFWVGVQNDVSIGVGPASVTAIAGSTSQNFTNNLTGPGNQWQQFTMNFAATSLNTTISLSGLSTAGGAYIGLDNADVELVASVADAGDYNNNLIVDAADYTVWRDHLGQSVTLPNDTTPGTVMQADYDVWKSNYGTRAGSGSGASVAIPEPATLLMLLSGTLTICSRRCQKCRKLVAARDIPTTHPFLTAAGSR
jgi:hypothetical protein